jgi:hypothetical protein
MMVNWTNITEPSQLLHIPNTNTSGNFWIMILFLIWVVFILGFIIFGIEVALLASAFICMVIGLFLVYMGLIAWGWALFFISVLIFFFLYIVWSNNR